MLVRVFRYVGCFKCLRIRAGLVRPKVRCPRCDAAFVLPAQTTLRLGKARRPELFALLMSRSCN